MIEPSSVRLRLVVEDLPNGERFGSVFDSGGKLLGVRVGPAVICCGECGEAIPADASCAGVDDGLVCERCWDARPHG